MKWLELIIVTITWWLLREKAEETEKSNHKMGASFASAPIKPLGSNRGNMVCENQGQILDILRVFPII